MSSQSSFSLKHWHDAASERVNGVSAQSFAELTTHPQFESACRLAAQIAVDRWESSPEAAYIRKDVVRFFYAIFARYLDAGEEGLTFSSMRAICAKAGYGTQTRARAMLIHMRLIGFIKPDPDPVDRRVKRYIPSPAMKTAFQEALKAELTALALIAPEATPAITRLSEPQFFRVYIRTLGEGTIDILKQEKPNPTQLFARRDAGLLVLYRMLLSGEEGDVYPPRGPVQMSVAGLAKQFKVSRSHVLKLMRDAEEKNYLHRNSDDRTGALKEVLRRSVTEFHAMVFIGVAACAYRALEAGDAMGGLVGS
jgi:DNA-binding MarR family transcriptional regulator